MKTELRFKLGEVYATPYGICRVVKDYPDGKGAYFRIMSVSNESKAIGWRDGGEFQAHVDDAVTPTVPESFTLMPIAARVKG